MSIKDRMPEADKPDDWPQNGIENQLENIKDAVEKFIVNPSYATKEVLVALICEYDLNQRSQLGMVRTTIYEVELINYLYLRGQQIQSGALRAYLYEEIGIKGRMQKMASWFPPSDKNSPMIKEYSELIGPLKLYYYCYMQYILYKDKDLAEQIIAVMKESIALETKDIKYEEALTNAYLQMLNDISYFRSFKRNGIWKFDRDEIVKLYAFAAELMKECQYNPLDRPYRGVLNTGISNFVLKSRNGYDSDCVCKYVSRDVAKESIKNNQIWIKPIEALNDEREERVLPEIMEDSSWSGFDWVKDIDFTPVRTYYVSSFSKTYKNASDMSDYGDCLYGYKNDKIAELIAPIIRADFISPSGKKETLPQFSQVITLDVIYDIEEAKSEIKYLCKLIDLFDISNQEKKDFLQEILQYWILSIKDPKWKKENERRYVIFYYDEYTYQGVDTSDKTFIKIETSLFLFPDFIAGNNPVKSDLRKFADIKRKAISMQPYMFCEDCFNVDFDSAFAFSRVSECPICGSKRFIKCIP